MGFKDWLSKFGRKKKGNAPTTNGQAPAASSPAPADKAPAKAGGKKPASKSKK